MAEFKLSRRGDDGEGIVLTGQKGRDRELNPPAIPSKFGQDERVAPVANLLRQSVRCQNTTPKRSSLAHQDHVDDLCEYGGLDVAADREHSKITPVPRLERNGIAEANRRNSMAKTKRSQSINILFIGNSFTQRNNLPGLLAEMAAARDLCIKHELISAGGASLRTHWNAGRAAQAIATGGYDYVVLQEQSTLPLKNAERMAENVRLFDEAIRRAGAKTVLYMTWARQHTPEAQQPIADAYTTIGKELGAIVVPVGLAWQKFLAKHNKPVLHDRDQSHPTLAGTYLAACVFLAVLLKVNPVGVESGPPELAKQDMKLLQDAAWKQFGLRK